MYHVIYFHPGLQKTATTSLQEYVFPCIDGVQFIGRCVDHTSNHQLYKDICRYCFNEERDESFDVIRKNMESLLEKTDVLISEEWFLTDYDGFKRREGLCWQKKIKRFFDLFDGFDVRVLLSVRSHTEVLFSLYCQNLQRHNPLSYGDFMNFVKNSNDAKAYDYGSIRQFFNSYNVEVDFLIFEKITSSNEYINRRISEIFEKDFACKIGNSNNIKKNADGAVYVTKSTFLGRLIRKVWHVISKTPIKKLFKSSGLNLNDIVVFFSGRKKINKLTEDEKRIVIEQFGQYEI